MSTEGETKSASDPTTKVVDQQVVDQPKEKEDGAHDSFSSSSSASITPSSSSSSSTTTSSSSSSSSSPPPPWIVETDTKTFVQGSEQDAVFKNHIRKMTGRFEFFEKILKRTTSIGQYSNYQFMIAPKGTGASPHFHNSALNILFTGKKMWALFPPSHSFYDTTPVRDWFERERAAATSSSRKNSRRRRKYMRCIQRPSEIVYVPDGWGHAVISLVDTSIGLAHLYNA